MLSHKAGWGWAVMSGGLCLTWPIPDACSGIGSLAPSVLFPKLHFHQKFCNALQKQSHFVLSEGKARKCERPKDRAQFKSVWQGGRSTWLSFRFKRKGVMLLPSSPHRSAPGAVWCPWQKRMKGHTVEKKTTYMSYMCLFQIDITLNAKF